MSFGSQAWVATRGERLEARLTLGGFLYFLGATALLWVLAIGYGFMLMDRRHTSLWILLGFLLFATLAAFLSAHLWVQRPTRAALVLDDEGAHHAVFGYVRWHEVGGIALDWQQFRGKRQAFLALGMEKGARVRGGWDWLRRWRNPAELKIPLQGLDHSPEQILEVALRLRDRVSPPRITFWFPLMSLEALAACRVNDTLLARMETVAAQAGPMKPGQDKRALRLLEELQKHNVVLEQIFESDRQRLLRQARRLTAFALGLSVIAALCKLALVYLSHR
jgi:hypothetical protein